MSLIETISVLLESKKQNGETLKPSESDTLKLINFKDLNGVEIEVLKQRLSKITLISNGKTNPKTAKEISGYEFNNYIMHLSPAKISGLNVCPKASKGCAAACLNGAGRGRFTSVQLARLRKTLYFRHFKTDFLNHLDLELLKIFSKALDTGVKAAVRLNGTSDIPFESLKVRRGLSLPALYPDIQFYDYTKILSRVTNNGLGNYQFTFSASEDNWVECTKALFKGFNVAVVFDTVPKEYHGFKVLNGDSHDFRFLDPVGDDYGFIIGLKAKGPAKKDLSGFVRSGVESVFKHVGLIDREKHLLALEFDLAFGPK